MTYAQLFNALRDAMPPGRSFNLSVSTWCHDSGTVDTKWAVFEVGSGAIGDAGRTHEASSAEELLSTVVASIAAEPQQPKPPTPEHVEDVGDIPF
ncbi:MAG TPA: hypothetical protein VHM19_23090 [Polyangiales bacterium]|jgi:hypothetical protein|nr:hypothetical protein [Polyangiales bacterium]